MRAWRSSEKRLSGGIDFGSKISFRSLDVNLRGPKRPKNTVTIQPRPNERQVKDSTKTGHFFQRLLTRVHLDSVGTGSKSVEST